MTNRAPKRAFASLLRSVERTYHQDERELNKLAYELFSEKGPHADQWRTAVITRVQAMCIRGVPLLYLADELIRGAIVSSQCISAERLISWVDWLSERGMDGAVAKCVEQFERRGIIVPPKQILLWAERGMGFRGEGFKPATMILIRGGCTLARRLPTKKACAWMLRSVERYDGDHGVLRFVRIVAGRVRYMRPGSTAHVAVLTNLTETLFATRKDTFTIHFLADNVRHLVRQEDWEDISLQLQLLLAQDAAEYSMYMTEQIELLRTPKPNV